MTIGSRIKQLREKSGLSQVSYGKNFNVSGPSVAQWETDRTIPNHDRLREIARFGGVSLHWLLEGVDAGGSGANDQHNNLPHSSPVDEAAQALDANFLMECQRAVTELCRELGVTPTWTITDVVRDVYTDAVSGARTAQEKRVNMEAVLRVYRRYPVLLAGG